VKCWAVPADHLSVTTMRQRYRFLIAVLAALMFLAPGAFATTGTKTPLPRKAKIDGPYRAKKSNKKRKVLKPLKPSNRSARRSAR